MCLECSLDEIGEPIKGDELETSLWYFGGDDLDGIIVELQVAHVVEEGQYGDVVRVGSYYS